ncbi:hypothetical protein ACTWPT_21040 [Nonomuraea sp. 3N208]|uniref:hypothetical protein n=1 Tax=Nonomuraea sp. 3N208 TaxID=3457421 RepID=UPI003FCE7613
MEIRYLGGPTAVLELGGVRLLTDPTFDAPGEYPIGDVRRGGWCGAGDRGTGPARA